jgi:hypothetical protein
MPRALLLVIAITCLATTAEAQSITTFRLGVALGASVHRTIWTPYGAHAALSLTGQPADSRFGTRIELLYEGGERILPNDGGRQPSRTTNATLALLVNTTYRVLGERKGLYLIGGLGLYHGWYSNEDLHGDRAIHRATGTLLGVNAGVGVDFTAFGRDFFVESRWHTAAFRDRVPLTLGIRF